MAAFNISMSYPSASGYSDFIDITEDVLESSIGDIKQTLESNEFDVGKITFANISLLLANEDGRYSEADNPVSIFPLKRDETIIKIDWGINSYPPACGNTPCGLTFLSKERTVFKGLIEENTAEFDVVTQTVKFKVLGIDSIINKVDTPFSSLSVSDDADTLIYKILNQTRITQFFTVDALNINTKNNFSPDSIAVLETMTCLESLQEILFLANSIMFVMGDIIYIRSRTVDPTSSFVFYGPSADNGIENIIRISKYSIGLNRCWNYWTWADTTLAQSFQDSIDKYGFRKKEIESDLITNTAKRNAVLTSYLTEFGFPKTELTLVAPMYTEITDLGFLNKINIDYPADVLNSLSDSNARYDQGIYDSSNYADTVNSLFIDVSEEWKILNKTTSIKSQELTFKIRSV